MGDTLPCQIMIERYSITASSQKLKDWFQADVPDFYQPRYNAGPTQLLPVITASSPQGISNFYWGTSPEWSKNKTPSEKVINIRVENLKEKATLRKSMLKTRCIIPADGFYAWKKVGKKTTIPYRIVVSDQDIFSIAGVWEEFEDEDGNNIHTFMMITTPANNLTSTVSDRMPSILDRQSAKIWLKEDAGEEELLNLLVPYTDSKTNLYTISPRINAMNVDVPSLIIPAPPADQFGNLTLFD